MIGPGAAARLALPLALLACTTSRLRKEDLPERPIAVVHRDREESERRAELLARREEPGRTPGVARIEDIGRLLGMGESAQDRRIAVLGHLAFVEPRSGQVERIAATLGGARPQCWSSDRGRLLFVSLQRGRKPQLYEYRLASREVRPVTHGAAHPAGCYAPDGRVVAVRVEPVGEVLRSRLVVIGPGSEERPLTEGPADLAPVWSPNGSLVVYERRGTEGPTIASVPAQGGPPRRLARGKDPTFTPDGSWVVFSARVRGRWQLWRMRPDGSGRLPMGKSAYDEHHPAVAPDGETVAFVGEKPGEGGQELLVRRLDGSGQRPLLDTGEAEDPTW